MRRPGQRAFPVVVPALNNGVKRFTEYPRALQSGGDLGKSKNCLPYSHTRNMGGSTNMTGMFHDDIVFGGEQLEPNVQLNTLYVLWDAGVVAENVKTSLGDDAIKTEVVISVYNDGDWDPPQKYGTFASAIASKVKKKANGDLPAVIKFEKVASSYDTDAFVMSFVQRYTGAKPDPTDMPTITAIDVQDDIPFD